MVEGDYLEFPINIDLKCSGCWYWERTLGTNKGECHQYKKLTQRSETCDRWEPCGVNAYKRRWFEKFFCKNPQVQQMKIGQLVTETKTGRRARITATNGDWQIEIAYIDSDGNDLHPNAIAWLHPSLVKVAENQNAKNLPISTRQISWVE